MADWSYLAAALAIGFFGSSHCIGMCGGISGALGLAVPGQKPAWPRLIGYSAGRVASYGAMGLLVGALGAYLATDIANSLAPLRLVAGLMLIAMALYLADWWRGLVWLERGGAVLWRAIQPLSRRLLPVHSTPQAIALGALWGWLPCGLVYSALAFALAQGSSEQAALAMLAFGLGTVPAVLATGAAAAQLRTLVQKPGVRLGMALLVLLFGLWTLWGAAGHGHDHGSGTHRDHGDGHHEHHQRVPEEPAGEVPMPGTGHPHHEGHHEGFHHHSGAGSGD
ncbi:sulfite exporter TauE/SafE family protein [Microbulbifer bruguierae]|uniref:Sulfite exporter TauE/SafE family protein n=1 Tax=Microbulbifer bruguierae TaxID=3029061 RepID=A0ABY8NCI3_9GAMM|nr:sulfite exporter TauE/SafE family protein [Microbulbifer bruguierae]WGL16636.1 sulfite exporter TauE/SafE family protein [Microbulbifer bruguierae]